MFYSPYGVFTQIRCITVLMVYLHGREMYYYSYDVFIYVGKLYYCPVLLYLHGEDVLLSLWFIYKGVVYCCSDVHLHHRGSELLSLGCTYIGKMYYCP